MTDLEKVLRPLRWIWKYKKSIFLILVLFVCITLVVPALQLVPANLIPFIGLGILFLALFLFWKRSRVFLLLLGIIVLAFLIYREWDSAKEKGRDLVSILEKEVVIETTLADFQEKILPAPVPKKGYYRVSIYADPEYSYVCPGAGGVTPGYTTGGDGFGNIQVQGSKYGSPVGDGETILIDEEKIAINFRFPTIQWNAIQDCKAIIIGGLKIKLYLKGI